MNGNGLDGGGVRVSDHHHGDHVSPVDHWTIVSRRIGDLEVLAILDASGPFFTTRDEAFPGATAEQWRAARAMDPGAFGAGDVWQLAFRCFLVRSPEGRITVVDTGIGSANGPASSWTPVPGQFPEALSAAGIDVGDVDQVVLTHLHSDHIGWSLRDDAVPMFPRATYTIQQDEVDALADTDSTRRYIVDPLERAGQLQRITGRTRLVGGPGKVRDSITAIPTPGHTPGHQSVLVSGSQADLYITGDVLVHAIQLVEPNLAYTFEDDSERARITRRQFLADARDAHATLATAHLHRPFVEEWTSRSATP